MACGHTGSMSGATQKKNRRESEFVRPYGTDLLLEVVGVGGLDDHLSNVGARRKEGDGDGHGS